MGPLLEGLDLAGVDRHLEGLAGARRGLESEAPAGAIDEVIKALSQAGFGAREGLELQVFESEREVWVGEHAQITLHLLGEPIQVLHQFRSGDDRDSAMLPCNAPSADVRGSIVLGLDNLKRGEILLTRQPLQLVMEAARDAGAAGILLCPSSETPEVEPDGWVDAIALGCVSPGCSIPVAHISSRVFSILEELAGTQAAEVSMQAEVSWSQRRKRMIAATLVGAELPQEEVLLVASRQGMGARSSCSSAAGLLGAALACSRGIERGELPVPRRSLTFLWGETGAAGATGEWWLSVTPRTVLSVLCAERLGAVGPRGEYECVLERTPDPGLDRMPEALPSGIGDQAVASPEPQWNGLMIPNGLAVLARMALVDVGLALGTGASNELPWQGGGMVDVFQAAGIPTVRLRGTASPLNGTSLEWTVPVRSETLRAVCVAWVAAGLAVADAGGLDLERLVDSVLRERYERQGAVAQDGQGDAGARAWGDWSSGARRWMAQLCSGELGQGGAW